MTFDDLVAFLRANGYQVQVDPPPFYRMGAKTRAFEAEPNKYRSAWVYGRGIRGGFCEPNDHSYWQLAGRFAADNKRKFNKWSQCPLVVEFPANDRQGRELLAMLRHLASPEGAKLSGTYYLHEGLYQYPVYAA